MKLFWLLIIFLSLTTISTANPKYGLTGCQDKCGEVTIPYPFGIGAHCSVNRWYNVNCNSSKPYLSELNNLEILSINLDNQTVAVIVSVISDCGNPVRNSSQMLNVDLDRSPFLFSKNHNKLVVAGCGNALIMDHGSVVTGCSTTCRNDSVSEVISNCLGINCCQNTIPYNLKWYSMNLTGLEKQVGVCGSGFLMDENLHVRSVAGNISHVPISLLWTLTDNDSSIIDCCFSEARFKVDTGNGKSVISHKCLSYNDDYGSYYTGYYEGNYYIAGGCGVIKECQTCTSDGSFCYRNGTEYNEDGSVSKQNWLCVHLRSLVEEKKSLGVILGGSQVAAEK